MSKPQFVMFDRSTIDTAVVEMQSLVDSIKARQGSAAQRLREATETALGHTVAFDASAVEPSFPDPENVTLGDVAQWVVDVNQWADQLRDETVRGIAKADPSDSVDALKTLYGEKKLALEAMLTLAPQFKVDVKDVTIPALRTGRPAGSGTRSTRKAGSKYAHFYRVVDGEKLDQSDSQDSLSSFAFYHGARIMGILGQGATNKGKGVNAGDLEKFLRAQGIDSPNGKAWTLDVDGVTYGMEVITPEAETADDNQTEEE